MVSPIARMSINCGKNDGRIRIESSPGGRRVPLNIRERNEDVVREQLSIGRSLQVSLFTGYFDPLHPIHLALAAESVIEGHSDSVVFLPIERPAGKPGSRPLEERFDILKMYLRYFDFAFVASDVKADRSNQETVELLREMNAENVNYNWIASSSGQTQLMIFLKMRAGKSLDEAIAEVISPYISNYIYFYYGREKWSKIVETFQSSPDRVRLIQIPDELNPISNLRSSLFRAGKVICRFRSGEWGGEVLYQVASDKGDD